MSPDLKKNIEQKTHKNQEWYHRSAVVKTTRRNSKFNKKIQQKTNNHKTVYLLPLPKYKINR